MLDAVWWEVGGRDGEAMGRAEAPPVFYVQPFIPRSGSACCLKHSQHIQVNETSSSQAHFGYFSGIVGLFLYKWLIACHVRSVPQI